jgi:hypothetical protein
MVRMSMTRLSSSGSPAVSFPVSVSLMLRLRGKLWKMGIASKILRRDRARFRDRRYVDDLCAVAAGLADEIDHLDFETGTDLPHTATIAALQRGAAVVEEGRVTAKRADGLRNLEDAVAGAIDYMLCCAPERDYDYDAWYADAVQLRSRLIHHYDRRRAGEE